jgi:hypothetical protein
MDDEFVAWPFPVAVPEESLSEFGRDFLAFMRAAYAEGFRPRHRWETTIDAGEPGGRYASLVFRGRRNGWEPWLCDGQRCERLGPHYNLPLGDSACVCVRPPFHGAAHLALGWLRGRKLPELLADFEFVGGYPAGIVLRPGVVSPSLILRAPEAEPLYAPLNLNKNTPDDHASNSAHRDG